MCAQVKFRYMGRDVTIIIRPGGDQIADANTPNVFDVRHIFPSDDSHPGKGNPEKVGGDIKKLLGAGDGIKAKLDALIQSQDGALTLYVQCKMGESRSPRCTAAFLRAHIPG